MESLILVFGLGAKNEHFSQLCAELKCSSNQVFTVPYKTDQKSRYQETVMEWAVHVFDFIMMHRLSSFHLIGFDLGGMACLQLAILLRGRDDVHLKSLTLIGSGAVSPARGLLRNRIIINDKPEWIRACFQKKLENDLVDVYAKGLGDNDILEDMLYAISEFDLTDQMHLLKNIPVLLIHGAQDRIVDYTSSLMIHDSLPSSKLLLLPNLGHWIHLEDCTVLSNTIKANVILK